ncbi:beta strand repeat-containing protein [Roseiconus lacunae]|uniref:Uncharacterized protein n=1 Tax=Roseiconus lacunae TaxID=2605694 RepID=A0ABT7PEU6_9BACT|nr:hypothetical protein [Roseiconus lacunae]MDM4014756.1 hypothetical protein [Roseiconus lacunae]
MPVNAFRKWFGKHREHRNNSKSASKLGQWRPPICRLNVTRLETRRVLNADGIVSELVVDAGDQANNGQQDSFEIEVGEHEVQIRVNGNQVSSLGIDQVDRIRIDGSDDNDHLEVRYLRDDFAELQIDFDGHAGNDTIQLSSDRQFDSLIYSISGQHEASVSTNTSSPQPLVSAQGIERIEQWLDVSQLHVNLGQTDLDANFEIATGQQLDHELTVGTINHGGTFDGDGLTIAFDDPDKSLTIDTMGKQFERSNTLHVMGLEGTLASDFYVRSDSGDELAVLGKFSLDASVLDFEAGQIHWDAQFDGTNESFRIEADDTFVISDRSVLDMDGATVELAAPTLTHDGHILNRGGSVSLDSGAYGTTLVGGTINTAALNEALIGGQISILGRHVGLLDDAFLDASGAIGGGRIMIGGDYQGATPTIRNAERTFIGQAVIISTNAIEDGNGGTVVVWANQWTRFYGTIQARGGNRSGNGGFVEVSGRQSLDFAGVVDTRGIAGSDGTLLLDPLNVQIGGSGADNAEVSDSIIDFTDGGVASFSILASALIDSAGQITIQATNDIIVDEAISLATASLALQAGNDLTINSSIQVGGDLFLEADSVHVVADGFGALSLTGTSTLSSTAGSINLVGATFSFAATAGIGSANTDIFIARSIGGTMDLGVTIDSVSLGALNTSGTVTIGQATTGGDDELGTNRQVITVDQVNVSSAISFAAAHAGHIALIANDGVSLSADLTTDSTLAIDADFDDDDVGTITVNAAVTVDSTDDTIALITADLDLLGNIDSGSASTTITESGATGITIGGSTAIGMLVIDAAELSRIDATGLTLSTAGDVTVQEVAAADSDQILGVVQVVSQSHVTVQSQSVFNAASIQAVDGISFDADLSTTVGDLDLDGDHDNSVSGGISFSGGIELNAAGSIIAEAMTDGISGSGALTLIANVGITLANDLTTAGTLTINSDADADGSGTLTVAALTTVTTGNHDIDIVAGDLDIGGSLDAGNGDIALGSTSNLGLGATVVAGMNVSGLELARIGGNDLSITADERLTVDAVTQHAGLIGSVSLFASAATNSVVFTGGASSFRELIIRADHGVQLGTNVTTTTGGVVIDADVVNGDDTGTLTIASGSTLNSNGQTIALTANDIVIDGFIDSGASTVTINDSDGDGIGLGLSTITNAMQVSQAELNSITTTGLSFFSDGGIDVGGLSNLSGLTGSLNLNANHSIRFIDAASQAQAIVAMANDGIQFNEDVSASVGELDFNGDFNNSADTNDAIEFADGVQLTAQASLSLRSATGNLTTLGSVNLSANDGITLADSLTSLGSISIDADLDAGDQIGTLTVASGAAIDTNDNELAITADSLVLNGTLDTGTSTLTLTDSDGSGVGIGSSIVANGLNITGAALAAITAGAFDVVSTANVEVGGVSAAQSGTVGSTRLIAGGLIDIDGATTFSSLALLANGGLSINADVTTSVADLTIDGDSDNAGGDQVQIADGVQLTSAGAMDMSATTGGVVAAGAVFFDAASGITLNSSLQANGIVTIDADTDGAATAGSLSVAVAATLSASDFEIRIRADELSIDGAIDSGLADIVITESDGNGVGLGDAASGGITLGASELARFTSEDLRLITAGDIVIDNVSQGAGVSGAFELYSAQTVTFTGQGSTFRSLLVNADDRVQVDVDVITSHGDLQLVGDADSLADTHDDMQIADGVTLRSAGAIALAASTNAIEGAGQLNLIANDGVVLSNSLSVSGSLTVIADDDAGDDDGTFTIATGASVVSTGTKSIAVTANELDWQGTIGDAGTTLTINESDQDGIGLGDAVTAGINLSGAELQGLHALTLTLTTGGAVNIDNVTAANSDQIVGLLSIRSVGTITLASTSVFNSLDLQADDGIVVQGDLTTDVGSMAFDGDVDGNADGVDAIVLSSGVDLVAATTLTLESTTGGISGLGSVRLVASDGIQIHDAVNVSGTFTADADFDDDGSGQFQSWSTLSTTDSVIDLTASDFDFHDAVSAGTGDVLLRDSAASGFSFGDNLIFGTIQMDNAELQEFTAANLRVFTQGNITLDHVMTPPSISDGIALVANGTGSVITFTNGASTFSELSVSAADGINFLADVTTTDTLTVNADFGGNVGVGTLTVASATTIDTNDHDISITGVDMDLQGNLDSGAADILIVASGGNGFGLGDTSVGFDIGGSELQRLTASNLELQTTSTTVVDNISASQSQGVSGTITLVADGSIDFQATGSIFNALSVHGNAVNVAGVLATDTGDLFLDGDANDSGGDDLVFAAGADVSSAGLLTVASTSGEITSPGSLTLRAADGISIEDDLTTSGALELHADTDSDVDQGLLSLAAGADVVTNNGLLTITAADLDIQGSFNSGAAMTVIQNSEGDGIGLGTASIVGGMNLSNTDLQDFTATGLTISTAGDIVVDGYAQSPTITGTTSLEAQSITFSGSTSTFETLSANADDQIVVATNVFTATGDLTLNADADSVVDPNDSLSFADGVTVTSAGQLVLQANRGDLIAAGELNLRSADGMVIKDSLTTAGELTIDSDTDNTGAGTFTVETGVTLTSNDHAISLTVGDLSIAGGVDSGTATITIEDSDGGGIGLGNATIIGGLNLSVIDLQDFVAGGLVLNTVGDIVVDGMSQPATLTGTTALNATGSGSRATFSGAASTFNTLSVTASDGVDFQADLSTTIGGLTIDADADSGDDLGTLSVAAGVTVSSGNQSLNIVAEDVDLQGAINSGVGLTTIEISDSSSIGVGDATFANGMTLENAELAQIVSGGLHLVGSSVVELNGVSQPASITGAVEVESSGEIRFVSQLSTFAALSVSSDVRVSVNADVTTNSGSLTLDGDRDDVGGAANSLSFAAGVQLTSEQGITLDSTSGAAAGVGTLQLIAKDGIQINTNVVTNGELSINADSDFSGGGTLTVATTGGLDGNDHQISIVADTVTVAGIIDSGTATTELIDSDGSGLALGNALVAGGLQLSNAESGLIFADQLVLRTSGNAFVDGFVQPASIGGKIDLIANGTSSTVTFTNTASSFHGLNVSAADGINVGADLTITSEASQFNADSDAGDSVGSLIIGPGVTLTTDHQDLTITANDVDLQGTIDANTGVVQLSDSDGSGIRIGGASVFGTLMLSQSELNAIVASRLDLVSTGDMNIAGITQNTGTSNEVRLVSDSTVSFNTSDSSFIALDVRASNGIDLAVDLSTSDGDLLLDGDANNAVDGNDSVGIGIGVDVASAGDLTIDSSSGTAIAFGNATISAANDLQINTNLTSQGELELTADSDGNSSGTVTIAVGTSVVTNHHTLRVTGDSLTIDGQLSSGTSTTIIADSDGGGVGLGSSTVAGGLNLSNAELATITAGDLQIDSLGNIVVGGAAQPASITDQLQLFADGTISFVNSSPTWTTIDAFADSGINVNVDLETTAGYLRLDADADDSGVGQLNLAFGVRLESANTLSLTGATLQGAGGITLNSTDGITIEGQFQTGGTISVDADTDAGDQIGTFNLVSGSSLTTGNQSFQLTANDVAFNGTIDTGTAAFHLTDSDGDGISLGNTSQINSLAVSDAEFGNLDLGDLHASTAGNIVIDGITAANSDLISGTVNLAASGAVTAMGGESTFNALFIDADNGIAINANVATDTGDFHLDGDANITAQGNDSIQFASGVQLISAGQLVLQAEHGDLFGSGDMQLFAADGVVIADDLSLFGNLSVNADTDAGDGVGTFSVTSGANVVSNDHTIAITAEDLSLTGIINAGTSGLTITDSDGDGIGLGNSTIAGGLNLANTDLADLYGSALTLSTGGSFLVNGVVQPGSITGTIWLTDTGSSANVTLLGGDSVFSGLGVNVGGNISIAADVQSTLTGFQFAAGGTFRVTAGHQVLGNGGRTAIVVTADAAVIGNGASGNETLKNIDSGVIWIITTGGTVTVGNHAIASDYGSVIVSASGGMIESENNNTTKLSTAGQMTLTGQGAIGASAGLNLGGTEALDVIAGSLSSSLSGTGGLYLRVDGDVNLTGVATADGDIEVLSTNSMAITGAVTAGGFGHVILQGPYLSFDSAGDVTAGWGSIDVSATVAGGLSVSNDAVFANHHGSFSGSLVNTTTPFAGTSDTGDALTDSNRIAQISVLIADAYASGIDLEIDWQEGDPLGPQYSAAPGNSRTRIVQSSIGSPTAGTVFAHEYENAPDPTNPSADINIEIGIIEIAGGTITLLDGGSNVFDAAHYTSQTIVLVVSSPILPFFVSIPTADVPETVVQTETIVLHSTERQRTLALQAPQPLNSSLGTAQQSSQRYYVLRIVTFGSEGEVKIIRENQEYRLPDLEDTESESGFELSQLPELFSRLPDDRYRIYMIDGQTERLVLDFMIRDGQPIEAEHTEDERRDSLSVSDDEPQLKRKRPTSHQSADLDVSELRIDQSQLPRPAAPALQQASEESRPSVIERFGKTPLVVAGGMVLTSNMFSQKASPQRKASIERSAAR